MFRPLRLQLDGYPHPLGGRGLETLSSETRLGEEASQPSIKDIEA
jgi:hypothetical protein